MCVGVVLIIFGLKKFLIVISGVVVFVKVFGLIGVFVFLYVWLVFDVFEGLVIFKILFCFFYRRKKIIKYNEVSKIDWE